MTVYHDIITGDEIISDSYELREIDGVVYEADCAFISKVTGAKASVDDDDAVVNLVQSFNLVGTPFDKGSYLAYIKKYLRHVDAALQKHGADADTITEFREGAQEYAKKLVSHFKDFEFYTGESLDPEGLVVLLNYREDGVTPPVIIWKHGLKETMDAA